jgi:hypothetical protein
MTVRGCSVAPGGAAVGAGAAFGSRVDGVAVLVGAAPGARVVTVSGGSAAPDDVAGALVMALGGALDRGLVTAVRGVGTPTVALVVALSPLLMITAVAMAPIATMAPMNRATGRQRRSVGHAHSSSVS